MSRLKKGRVIKIKNQKMKRALLTLVIFSLLLLPVVGIAQEQPDVELQGDVDVLEIMLNIANWLFAILLIFAAIMIIIAAYMFVTAAGNPETVAKARTFVIYALVGVAVAAVARGLVNLVQRITGTE